jgi:hypothetical protein
MKNLFTRLAGALTGALVLLSTTSLAPAAQRITFDPGGNIMTFIDRYNGWRVSGERVVIDGMCISACTMITGLLPTENVCVTPFARLAFHSAYIQYPDGRTEFAREATRLIWMIYPPHVRDMLLQRGWQEGMEHPDLIYIEGADLHRIFRPCTAADIAATTPRQQRKD